MKIMIKYLYREFAGKYPLMAPGFKPVPESSISGITFLIKVYNTNLLPVATLGDP